MGGRIVNEGGGERVENYMHPAVVYPVKPEMRLHEVEQFGPIVPVREYEDVSEVMNYAVESQFGQQVSVFGYDPKVLGPMIDALVNQVSRVNLNTQCQRGPDSFPFTGRKASAEGTLSVEDALKRFSIRSLSRNGLLRAQPGAGQRDPRGPLEQLPPDGLPVLARFLRAEPFPCRTLNLAHAEGSTSATVSQPPDAPRLVHLDHCPVLPWVPLALRVRRELLHRHPHAERG
jgi:hypothetical protein